MDEQAWLDIFNTVLNTKRSACLSNVADATEIADAGLAELRKRRADHFFDQEEPGTPDGPHYRAVTDWRYGEPVKFSCDTLAEARELVVAHRAKSASSRVEISMDLGKTWIPADDNGKPLATSTEPTQS